MMIGKVKINLPFGGYDSPEDCRAKLLAVIDADHFPNELLLNHAIEVRMKEIRWRYLYIPFVMFGFLAAYLLYGALVFHVSKYVYLSLVLIIILTIVFRVTFYQSYLDVYNRILFAATSFKESGELPLESETATPEEPTLLQESKSDLQELSALQTAAPRERKVYGKELEPFFTGASAEAKYGRSKIFLLDQLLRRECKLPSIFDERQDKIDRSVPIFGCVAKNVISQFAFYYSRQSIELKTRHSKTTHKKYLKSLQAYYSQIDDPMLEKQAKNLRFFIAALKVEPKT